MQLTNRKLTRRMLLGITNSCYDPLGLLAPLTVKLKIELRDLYRKTLNLGWDDSIPLEKRKTWVNLLQLLKTAEKVRFKRCIRDINSIGLPELINFSDGVPDAMCAVAYIRWQLGTGKFCSRLITAKTRVTPLERVTIPRIEMQAAVMGVRLGKAVIQSCCFEFMNVTYISDSKYTLATLAKDSTALKESPRRGSKIS